MVELSRRGLLSGSWRSRSVFRPPWSGDENHFLLECTRCDKCLPVCETRVLERGRGGYPEVNFAKGECTFCYACAQTCPEQIFLTRDTVPWGHSLTIDSSCLAYNQVECRSCQDSCDKRAIKFSPSLQGVAVPELDASLCNTCGACISGCPVSAITLRHVDAS